jgi:hypothetical protein
MITFIKYLSSWPEQQVDSLCCLLALVGTFVEYIINFMSQYLGLFPDFDDSFNNGAHFSELLSSCIGMGGDLIWWNFGDYEFN